MASNVKLFNFVLDSICFIVVLIVYIVIKTTVYGTTEGLYPTKQGFLCGDASIQKPLKEEYLRYAVVCPLSYIIPIVVILIVEITNNRRRSEEDQEDEEESYGLIKLKPWMARMISLIFVFIFGGFLTEIVVELSKISVGELRPSFLAVCQANTSQADCQQGYVTKDVCTGDPYDVKIARLSFPSCHAAISMYGMLFLAFYIHSAVKTETKLMKPLLQTVLVSLSLFAGLSPLAANSHFLTDVVAGFILGAIFTWLIVSSFLPIQQIEACKVLKLFAIRIRKPKVYTLLPQQRQTSVKEIE